MVRKVALDEGDLYRRVTSSSGIAIRSTRRTATSRLRTSPTTPVNSSSRDPCRFSEFGVAPGAGHIPNVIRSSGHSIHWRHRTQACARAASRFWLREQLIQLLQQGSGFACCPDLSVPMHKGFSDALIPSFRADSFPRSGSSPRRPLTPPVLPPGMTSARSEWRGDDIPSCAAQPI